MVLPPADRRHLGERRALAARRSALDHRSGERRRAVTPVETERRLGAERREGAERRSVAERRGWADRRVSEATVGDHIHHALQQLASVADSGQLDDEVRRDLDTAIFRLRFALDRLENGDGS